GTSVYDTTTLGGLINGVTPTGTVTYEFFHTIDGTGSHSDEIVNLAADGSVPHSMATGALAAGSYSYIAIYSGDTHYQMATGLVEPLIMDKGTLTLTTTMHNASHTVVPEGGHVPLGTSMHDNATLSGANANFTPTGAVSFTLNAAAVGNVAPEAPFYATSA